MMVDNSASGFSAFLRAFPKRSERQLLNGESLGQAILREFRVRVPDILCRFWSEVGAGYFGQHRELYFFGEGGVWPAVRDGLIDWNRRPFFREIGPEPVNGGPLFFAETCFGVQIGMQMIDTRMAAVFFDVDCYESYILTPDIKLLFDDPLADPTAITEPDRLQRVAGRLGLLPDGQHYAPIVSPLVGGTDETINFSLQDPVVHFTTALAVRGLLG